MHGPPGGAGHGGAAGHGGGGGHGVAGHGSSAAHGGAVAHGATIGHSSHAGTASHIAQWAQGVYPAGGARQHFVASPVATPPQSVRSLGSIGSHPGHHHVYGAAAMPNIMEATENGSQLLTLRDTPVSPTRAFVPDPEHHAHGPVEPIPAQLPLSELGELKCPAGKFGPVIRRHPMHFCAKPGCCAVYAGEGEMKATDFEHLPVCHNPCFKRERDALEELAQKNPGFARWSKGLKTCHRACHIQSLRQIEGAEHANAEVVPLNRSLGELIGVEKCWHKVIGVMVATGWLASSKGSEGDERSAVDERSTRAVYGHDHSNPTPSMSSHAD